MDDQQVDRRRERFEQVAREVTEPVRRFLVRRTGRDLVEDVLADTLLVLWRRLDDVPDDPMPWAYGVARGCLANAERAARRQARVAGRIARLDPPRTVESPPAAADPELAAALAALSPDDREVLRLWAWEQLTPAEIARVQGITANTASARLSRARTRLAGRLRHEREDAGHEGPGGRHG